MSAPGTRLIRPTVSPDQKPTSLQDSLLDSKLVNTTQLSKTQASVMALKKVKQRRLKASNNLVQDLLWKLDEVEMKHGSGKFDVTGHMRIIKDFLGVINDTSHMLIRLSRDIDDTAVEKTSDPTIHLYGASTQRA